MVIAVTGASGQFGQVLKSVKDDFPKAKFHFLSSAELDITDAETVRTTFNALRPDFCINAAAYTAVDKAESEPEKAALINVTGAANVAKACAEIGCTLVHISTDFVFDGTKGSPYTESDPTNPIGVYGRTKRDGENEIARITKQYFIIRTSWLFSDFGHNFYKTMLRLGSEREVVSVVNDQTGTPTHCEDLARAIMAVIENGDPSYGIYHFSNIGETTWHGFAAEIFRKNSLRAKLVPVTSNEFPTAAKRPCYSVMDKSKIAKTFNLSIRNWQDTV